MKRSTWAMALAAAFFFNGAAAHAVDLSNVTFNGFVDMEYTQSSNNADNENGSFHQHHLSFLLDVPVDDRVSGHFHIEFDHGVNSAAPNGGDIIVEKSFIQYTYNDLAQLRFGKVLTPFGYYNEVHDATPVFLSVFVPQSIYRHERRGGTSMFPKWTTGVNLLGIKDFGNTVVDYIIYVGNGENLPTVNEAEDDSNRNKAAGGRLTVQPGEVTSIAISFYSGEKAESASKLTTRHTTYGAMLATALDELNIVAEFAHSDVGGVVDTGMYGQLSYMITKAVTPYVRYEYSDPDNGTTNDSWTEMIAGVNLKPTDSLIFKLEVANHLRGANNTDIGLDAASATPLPKDYVDFRFAVTLFF